MTSEKNWIQLISAKNYTNAVLTIIALCLIMLLVGGYQVTKLRGSYGYVRTNVPTICGSASYDPCYVVIVRGG
jgi:hypothetical protein